MTPDTNLVKPYADKSEVVRLKTVLKRFVADDLLCDPEMISVASRVRGKRLQIKITVQAP